MQPDSFSDGGRFLKLQSTYKQIKKLKKDGADIIDIGGRSQGQMLIQWIAQLSGIELNQKLNMQKNKLFISLDTRKSFVLNKSLSFKINLLNDVSGLSHDVQMVNILRETNIPFVLHHIQGTPKTMQKKPKYKNVLLDIYDYFEKKLAYIKDNKINHCNIIIDPGIGFGKNLKHNITILNKISIFTP